MPYYRLVLRDSAAPDTLMGAKEFICTEEQRELLEEKWRVAEERSEIDNFPWERKFTLPRVLGAASCHQDHFQYEHVDLWDRAYPLEMAALDTDFVYVTASDGSAERFVQIRIRELKQHGNLLFPNIRTAAIAGDRDLIVLQNTENDEQNRARITNIVSSTAYFYERSFPNEAAARADMEAPCAVNLRTFFDEIFGDK